jgi:putative hydrolase of the HAD superfamily
MTEYVAVHLGLDAQAADRLRHEYWQRYGATLIGLMRHHAVDPHHFLRSTHDFPALHRMVAARRELKSVLRRLRGRKFVFSNSPQEYLEAVLKILGIRDLFHGVCAIEHTGFRPKPDVRGFRRLLRAERLDAARCIMVEDSLENLRTAKRLGMKTVWVDQTTRAPAWVDINVRHVIELPARIRKFLPSPTRVA